MPFKKYSRKSLYRILFLSFSASTLLLFSAKTISAQTSPGVYWGAYIRGAAGNPTYPSDYGDVPYDMRTLDRFETNAGKKASIVHFAQAWKTSGGSYNTFPASLMTDIRNHGSIPMLNWGSWQLGKGVNQPEFKLSKITAGNYDTYITDYARAAKAWGHPFFFRFNHEMNIGGQFAWNFSDTWTDPATGTTYKNTANDYINMWRHVVDIFRREGATNVTWVWCPNIYFRSGSKALPFMQAYPGDGYVDWTCVDGYNKSTTMSSFSSIFTDSYNVLMQKVTGTDTNCSSLVSGCNPATKPMMIGEWSTVEAGDGGTKKANWIKDAFLTQLPKYFPGIKAVSWFNWNSTAGSLIIESTGTALSGFKSGVASTYYAANNFSGISTSPIKPLSALPSTTVSTPTPTRTTLSPTLPPAIQPVNGLFVSDNFSRTLTGTWGSSDTGGVYTNSPLLSASNFSVNGSSGIMKVANANSQMESVLADNTALDSELKVRIKADKLPYGGIYLTGMEARKNEKGNYRMLLSYDSGKLYLRAQKYVAANGTTYDLGSKFELAGVTPLADNYYWLRAQISGVNPTTIKMKAWHINAAEPADWQLTVSDSATNQITTGGGFALLSRVGSGNTTNPVTFNYDEFRAGTIGSALATPVPLTVKVGDANGDGIVNSTDLNIWLSNYGKAVTGGPSTADFNKDGIVNSADYALLLKNYTQ